MLVTVGVRKLKQETSKILGRVRDEGEIVEITYHGEVIARLVPVKEVKTHAEELAALWAEMDRLAQEVSAQWSGSPDAVEVVREGGREL